MKIYVKNRTRRKDEFQFFMHQFVEECIRQGFITKADRLPTYRFYLRSVLRRILVLLYRCVHSVGLVRHKGALLVTGNGVTITDEFFPYYFKYECVPFLWDCWPSTWKRMYDAFKLYDVRLMFCTSRQVVEMINRDLNVKAYWIPEGIDESGYKNEKRLNDREYDVFEMGRQMPKLHSLLQKLHGDSLIRGYHTSNINPDGTLPKDNVAYSEMELKEIMSQSKIMICFPQCDTNPGRGGNIETLTQRYWEAMLSGCVMLGRAPQELIDLIGYNPVIDVDWNDPEHQIKQILENVNDYQELVDKNYYVAKEKASWKYRIPMVKEILEGNGYISNVSNLN